MLQNIKVDVIYYLTATDFEMEFNLCGCCRMRLLTDKAADRKGFVHMLSRAVSRSRVIICCGPLFGEAGLIAGISAAIGRPLEKVDNKAYGINGEDEIQIIKGSLPLVTSNGIFGGCIIESGPQSIILLSESKGIRKTLMTSLIHPYIEDISYVPTQTVQETKETAGPEIKIEAIGDIPVPPVTPVVPPVIGANVSVEDVGGQQENNALEEKPSEEVPTEESPVEEETTTVEETTAVEENSAVELITEIEEIEEAAPIEENIEGLVTEIDEETENEEEEIQTQEDAAMPLVFEEESAVEEVAPVAEEAPLVLPQEAEEEFEEEIPMEQIVEENNTGLFIESQDVKFTKKNYYETDYVAGADSERFFAEPDEYIPAPSYRLPLIIATIVLLVILALLAYLLVFVPLRDGVAVSEYITNLFAVTKKIGIYNKFI